MRTDFSFLKNTMKALMQQTWENLQCHCMGHNQRALASQSFQSSIIQNFNTVFFFKKICM